ncbi:MAG: L,D-transpeptidase [Gallionella sp.]
MKITIPVRLQQLRLYDEQQNLLREYSVSTATNGVGELKGSYCTPRGKHVVRAKIGNGLPENAILVGRRPTGELYTTDMRENFPERDWILTRILWLSGCEAGFNRLGATDTMRRYIYIHGSPDSARMGIPGSHGCIRMRNRDIVELFDLVPVGTEVEIIE